MKNNTKFIGLMALSACLLCASPDVVAQASPSDNTATTRAIIMMVMMITGNGDWQV
jgi:hypothetical protein